MKATGIIRGIDDLGRIVIPKEIRRTLAIKEGESMEMFIIDGGVVFKPYRNNCFCCGLATGLVEVNGIKLCDRCIGQFIHQSKT